jgi:TRAP-type uncharacterized transport system substrate-binding protein
MKYLINVYVLLISSLLFNASIKAQELVVSTGAEKGSTYTQMFNEMIEVCSTPTLKLRGINSTGSIENLDRLLGNQVNGAFTQSDILFMRTRNIENTQRNSIKTLLALHPEEVHIVIRTVHPQKEQGLADKLSSMFGKSDRYEAKMTDLTSLGGRKVGSWGGGQVTANAIKFLTDVPYEVVGYQGSTETINALNNGEVDAIIGVGGAPLGWVTQLGVGYTLLPILEAQREKLKAIYNPTVLTYSPMGANEVNTVSTDALLVTREYRTRTMVGRLAELRKCVQDNIDEFKERLGYHAKWQLVDPKNQGKLPWLELSNAQ